MDKASHSDEASMARAEWAAFLLQPLMRARDITLGSKSLEIFYFLQLIWSVFNGVLGS